MHDGERLRLAVIQMNSKENDRDRNVASAEAYIREACKSFSPDLVVLPEFFNTEYFAQYRDYKYLDYAEPDSGPTISAMRALARELGIFVIATIYELESPGLFFDTAIVIDDQGNIMGKYRKVHPAAVRSLEKIYFAPGSKWPIFRIKGWNVGVMICYDTFFPETARCLSLKGAELIAVPFATFTGHAFWESLHRTRALENGCFVAPCNKVGKEGEWSFGGRSMVVDPLGEILGEASESEDQILAVELRKDRLREARAKWPMYRDRRPECYTPISQPYEEVRQLV